MSLHDEFVPAVDRGLSALSKILDRAAAHAEAKGIDPAVLLSSRLYPDMFPLSRQVQIACDQGRRAVARLKGEEPASVPDTETTIADLKARIALSIAALDRFTPADGPAAEGRKISFRAGPRELSFTGTDYIRQWILPNFYFHVTTAYAILRHNGVDLGKTDYLGG